MRADAKADEQRLELVLAIRSIVKAMDPLAESLRDAKSDLLVSARTVSSDKNLCRTTTDMFWDSDVIRSGSCRDRKIDQRYDLLCSVDRPK